MSKKANVDSRRAERFVSSEGDFILHRGKGKKPLPDVSVVCGEQRLDPEDPAGNTLINPAVIVEVRSPATEAYDLGERLGHYKLISLLRDVLHVALEEHRIEHWQRDGDHWTLHVSRSEESAALPWLGVELQLGDVYRSPLEQ